MSASLKFDADRVDELMAPFDTGHLPGAALAIAIDGTPIYRKGFGLATMELPVRLAPDMRMRIASITKQFIGFLYLLLCEEGNAGLDDEIGLYLPDLGATNSSATVRQLLGHTSGLLDSIDVSFLVHGSGKRITDEEMIGFYQEQDQRFFAPSERWSYNNGGYILVSRAIERLSGRSLEDLLVEKIFAPIGMHDTVLRRWDSDFVSNSATLHMLTPSGKWTRDYMGMELSGCGGLVSTMDDMLRWLKHLGQPVIGSAESWRLLCEPQQLRNGASTGYGLGMMVGDYRGLAIVHHAGRVRGGNAQLLKVPELGLDIALAFNRSDTMAAATVNEIIDACVEGLAPLTISPAGGPLTADYRSPTTGRVVQLSALGPAQRASIDGGPPMPMVAEEEGILDLPAAARFLSQRLVCYGDGGALELVEFGAVDRLERVEPEQDGSAFPEDVFSHPGFAATARFLPSEAGARLLIEGRFGSNAYLLSPVCRGVWRAQALNAPVPTGCIVTIADDASGITLRSGRSQLEFRKPKA